jgi:hypothetical protein
MGNMSLLSAHFGDLDAPRATRDSIVPTNAARIREWLSLLAALWRRYGASTQRVT